jgi:hypothetical protein
MAAHEPANLAQSLDGLKSKDKSPSSARVLHTWIAQAQNSLGSAGPRLGWLVAATVVTAALQRAVDESGAALFLLKVAPCCNTVCPACRAPPKTSTAWSVVTSTVS